MLFTLTKQRIIILLSIIVLVAAFLRFYKITEIPVSLYWDEVAATYNAYSIATTGKDEFGTKMPLLFRSFEDYKAPGNIYLTSLVVPIFGLNEFSARFTSAVAGTVTVLLSFFLAKELLFLTKKSSVVIAKKKIAFDGDLLGLVTAFLVAIGPWDIQFSRTGFEANVAVAISIGAIWLFLRSLRRNTSWNYYCSMILFSLDFYFYRSIWVFLPLLLFFLFFFMRDELFNKKRLQTTVIGIVLFVAVLLPFIPVMVSPQGLVRANQVNVFTNSQQLVIDAAQKREKSTLFKIIYNQRLIYPEIILGNYLSHFSPQFLFISGDGNERHSIAGMGLLYIWGLPFILFGLYIVIFKLSGKIRNIVITWVLLAPIPAALSVPSPHALRSLNLMPMPSMLIALGIIGSYLLLKPYLQKPYFVLLTIVIVCFFVRYLYLYYVITPNLASADWGDGYKQLTQYMIPRENQYSKLVVSAHYWKPYIYFLFYKKYSPFVFQNEHGNEFHFGKYVFSGTKWGGQTELDNINLQQFAQAKHILVAMSPEEWETQKNTVHYLTAIKNHDNQVMFIVGDME